MELRASLGEVEANSFSAILGNVTADVLEPLYQGNPSQNGLQTDMANVAKAGGDSPFPAFSCGLGGMGENIKGVYRHERRWYQSLRATLIEMEVGHCQ